MTQIIEQRATTEEGGAHTPAPWHVTPMRGSAHYGVFQVQPWADRQRAMLRGEAPDTGSADECYANSRLIASAPELLAAGQKVLAWWDGTLAGKLLSHTEFPWAEDAEWAEFMELRAAIAKATGAA